MTDLTEDERNSPIGLYNFANSYWEAAKVLRKAKLRTTHPDSPVSFLYFHAIELYLKSFLRLHGVTTAELRSKAYGHSAMKLSRKAVKLGISFDDEDIQVFSIMDTNAGIRTRYLQTGYYQTAAHEALDRTCKSLSNSVYSALKKIGVPVRRPAN